MKLKVMVLLFLLIMGVLVGMEGVLAQTSPFTGLALPERSNPRPILAIIDNHGTSRPQAGLEKASIVYEFPVEGGITRLLALFYDTLPSRIGPIRSARPYFIEKNREYSGILLHCGASPQGYELLNRLDILTLDAFEKSHLYWRSEDRNPPINLYTGWPYLREELLDIGSLNIPNRFQFLSITITDGQDADVQELEIVYSDAYRIQYEYQFRYGTYRRFMNGEPHETDTGTYLEADNVIVQFVQTQQVDDEGRLAVQTQGSGTILLFRDGRVIEGTWLKAGPGWTSYLDSRGRLLSLNTGTTWIEMVPLDREVKY